MIREALAQAEPGSSRTHARPLGEDHRSAASIAYAHAATLKRRSFEESVVQKRAHVDQRVALAVSLADSKLSMPEVHHPQLCSLTLDDQPPPFRGVGDARDALVNVGLDKASADGSRGRNKTGVRAWRAHCSDEGMDPDRPLDPNIASLWDKLKEEWLAMRFVCALVQERGVSVETASSYWSSVQGWHAIEHGIKIGGGLKMERLPAMLKGLKRVLGQAPARIRRGLAPQALRRAMDLLLNKDNPEHANLRAALAVAFQGLLRGEEFAIDPNKRWVAVDRLTRGDIVELTAERLILMMHPCKNMRVLKGKTVPLVIGAGGTYIDAVAEVRNMLRVDPARGKDPHQVPLFRVPSSNSCITKPKVHSLVKELMAAVNENPDHFGTHSMRIGGATALFARGADPTVIRTMGRWSSDIYHLYVRACFERCCEWTRMAGSVVVTDVVTEFDEVEAY